jgi:hypothetical protein
VEKSAISISWLDDAYLKKCEFKPKLRFHLKDNIYLFGLKSQLYANFTKHSIEKKSTFYHVLPNTRATLKSDDFKNTIFKNAIFKIALIEIVLPNGPLIGCEPCLIKRRLLVRISLFSLVV